MSTQDTAYFTKRGELAAAAGDCALDQDELHDMSTKALEDKLVELRDRATQIMQNATDQDREANQKEHKRIGRITAQFDQVEFELTSRGPPKPRSMSNAIPGASNVKRIDPRMGFVFDRKDGIGAKLFGKKASPWNMPEDFFRTVVNGIGDPRLIYNATGTEGVGVDGGFDVPPEFYMGVIDQALQQAEFAPRARIFPTQSNNLTIPLPDMQNRASAIAGIAGNWAAENQSQTAQVLKWRSVELKLNKVFILAEASGELAEDGLNYSSQLTNVMSEATAYTLDDALLAGTGAGQPIGLIGHASAVSISPESGQAAGSILYQNLVNMYSRMAPACQKRAVWYISSSAWPQLLSMVFPGSTTPVLLSTGFNDSAAGTPAGTIFGRPVVTTEIARALGDVGDITFADMSQYALLVKNAARIEYSNAPGFGRDVGSWRLILRVSGQPLWNTTITPHGGGSSLTWATYIAAR